MRLVTWNLGHRTNGDCRSDGLVAALTALEPDIAVLVDRSPGTSCEQLLAALAGMGLGHQLATAPGEHDGRVTLASRLEMVPGSLDTRATGGMPSHLLHAYAPAGDLDVISLTTGRNGHVGPARQAGWDWLHRAATTLKQRRTILIGDFASGADDAGPGHSQPLRRFISEGWQHAMPTEGAPSSRGGEDAPGVDHAFLSPLLQRIDTHYALGAAGLRLAGKKDSPSERPVLVVDLQ
jgi:hypothetical protein